MALVTRNATKLKDGVSAHDGKVDFEVMGMTEVELSKSILQPQSGGTFIDLFGFRHRIRFVTQTDITWVCYCTPSQTNPPQ